MFPYNVIMGKLALNLLGAVMFTLSLKYPLPNGCMGVVRGDQVVAQECYLNSL